MIVKIIVVVLVTAAIIAFFVWDERRKRKLYLDHIKQIEANHEKR